MLDQLAKHLSLHDLLKSIQPLGVSYLDHWKQGEFHHDLVYQLEKKSDLPGSVIVISVNCNGGVKELLCLDSVPKRWALWHYRCPDNPEFSGELPKVLGFIRTEHWFNPCEVLDINARSEMKPEFRLRQRGGGWVSRSSSEELSVFQPPTQ